MNSLRNIFARCKRLALASPASIEVAVACILIYQSSAMCSIIEAMKNA
jgi:hypothetical protein